MRYKVWSFTVLTLVLATLNCSETVTETGSGTLVARISVQSPFVSDGFFLVGDQVQFTGTVTSKEGGQTIPSSGLRFTSDAPSVVEIVNANTGQATFKSVGTARVTVTFDEPALQGTSEKLTAFMDVDVTEFDVELSLASTITGSAVDTLAALENDTVEVSALVRYEGTVVNSGGIEIASSSDTGVIDPSVPAAADRAALAGAGQATLTIQLLEPDIPGPSPLTATIGVNVESVVIELSVASQVPGSSHLANGDTLVTDSVQFSGVVITAGTNTIPISGATWTSSDAGVVNVIDPAAGLAEFEGVGTAVVRVSFTDPIVPIQTDSLVVRVTTLVPSMTLESQYTAAVTDTLVTDSVWVIPAVTKDGQVQGGVQLLDTESTDPSVVAVRDGPAGVVVFPDTGLASIIMTVDQPDLPRRKVADTVDVEVGTYALAITGPGTTPIMGDTVDYDITVTDTRGDTALTTFDVTFTSSDTRVIRYFNSATGLALARDTGMATVGVRLDSPDLPDPDSTLTDALAPTNITEERFYGTFDQLTGDFQDTVRVLASEVHKFTANTEVRFPNESSGFVDSVTATFDTLWFVVGAGTNTGQLTFINLEDDLGGARDTVLSRASFAGGGTVDDPFEPNDTFPLPDTAAVNITSKIPFGTFLSVDTARTAPSDTNFFWLRVPSAQTLDLNIMAETQQDADIDFFICNGINTPPTDYDSGSCQRPPSLNGSGRTEQELGVSLGTGSHVFAFYCVSGCTVGEPIVTYKVTIREP